MQFTTAGLRFALAAAVPGGGMPLLAPGGEASRREQAEGALLVESWAEALARSLPARCA